MSRHTAKGAVGAASEILDSQIAMYSDLPRDVNGLHSVCNPIKANSVDAEGKFIWSEGEPTCTFGRYRGWSLKDIATNDPEYLQ